MLESGKVRKSVRYVIVGVTLAFAGILHTDGMAIAGNKFEWRLLLGQTRSNLIVALGTQAQCREPGNITFDVPEITDESKIHDYWSWDRPISGYIFPRPRDSVSMASIQSIKCSIDASLEIDFKLFHDQVFSIELNYPRCAAMDCDLTEKPFDTAIFANMTQAVATDLPDANDSNHYYPYFYSIYENNAHLKNKLFEIAACQTDKSVNSFYRLRTKIRSLIEATLADGVWRAINMKEFYVDGWLSRTVEGHIIACQHYSLIEQELNARKAFLENVKAILADRVKKYQANKLDAQRQLTMIQAVQ